MGENEDWFDYQTRILTEAFTYIESLKDGLSFYVNQLEYSFNEANDVRAKHRSSYLQVKRDGWKTAEIKMFVEAKACEDCAKAA